jgi:hypothetical protein
MFLSLGLLAGQYLLIKAIKLSDPSLAFAAQGLISLCGEVLSVPLL